MNQKARRSTIRARPKRQAVAGGAARDSKGCVLAYDLGGTKISAGVVSARGRVLAEKRVPVLAEKGKAAVLAQLAELGRELLDRYPRIVKVGMASAGPLHSARGVLLDPTNLARGGEDWGVVPIARILGQRLKRKVHLENDAAAAILAEHWVGAARGYRNAMILTLGTGLGTGIICNGELVRAGRGLHPEAGHLILKAGDVTAPCGCGNFGCAEAYLSGRMFTHRYRDKAGDTAILADAIAELARKKYPLAAAAFEEYAEMMAVALHNYVVLYAPEIIVFTGSFAAASDLFLERSRARLTELLLRRRKGIDMMPKLAISKLHNQAGLIGGAFVALHAQK